MNLLKPSKLGITSCIPSPHGRLQTIGDGNENSPMRGVLAVAQQGWENEIQQTQVDEAFNILVREFVSKSQGVEGCCDFESNFHATVYSCHRFIQERDFSMSSLFWSIENSRIKIGGIGWTFGWHSSHGCTKQVLSPTSVLIKGAGSVLVSSIGIGKIGDATNWVDIGLFASSRICLSIASPNCGLHVNCSASDKLQKDFEPEFAPKAERHQAMCILESNRKEDE